MKRITKNIVRLAILCLAVASLSQVAKAQTIEAQVSGYPDYVLIVPGIATGKRVVWNSDFGRYVSGAVKRGERLRISGGHLLYSLITAGTSPALNVSFDPIYDQEMGDFVTDPSSTYTNTSTTVTTSTTRTKLTLRGERAILSSISNEKDVEIYYTTTSYLISVPIVSIR